jgi:Lar family restriction alleviation protein
MTEEKSLECLSGRDAPSDEHHRTVLEPCPFCGGRDIHVRMLRPAWALCATCRTEGPVGEKPTEAIAAWNQRMPLRDKVGRLRTALENLCDQIADTEMHGDGAHDEECSVCRAHAEARAALSQEGLVAGADGKGGKDESSLA